ncbi:MAG: hypothetical protein WEC35_05530 [Nitrosopumilaceae archaeon]
MSISNTILSKIKKDDLSRYPALSACTQPMDAGLWALLILRDHFGMDERHFTAKDLSALLLKRKVSFSKEEITKGFTRAGKKIDRKKGSDDTLNYMIMDPGKVYLEKFRAEGNIAVIFVDGKNQRTDYQKFSNLVNNTKGEIRIVDKFYSKYSLDIIQELGKNRKVKLLTAKIAADEDQAKFQLALQRFRSEYKNAEFRVHGREFELHDRYIIADDSLILLGRGLQDVSGKESFVISLKNGIADDIKEMLNLKFEERWKKASNLK